MCRSAGDGSESLLRESQDDELEAAAVAAAVHDAVGQGRLARRWFRPVPHLIIYSYLHNISKMFRRDLNSLSPFGFLGRFPPFHHRTNLPRLSHTRHPTPWYESSQNNSTCSPMSVAHGASSPAIAEGGLPADHRKRLNHGCHSMSGCHECRAAIRSRPSARRFGRWRRRLDPPAPHPSFISSTNMVLQHFELTSITAYCSVHMPRHPKRGGPGGGPI